MDPEKLPSVEELKSRDLNPQMVARETKPKPTWFVKRLSDDYTFPVEEKEAWDMLYNQSNWKRHDFQFVGYSDGTTYARITKEALAEANRLVPLIESKKGEVARYVSLEDRLMMEEIVDMEGDPSDATNEGNKKKVLRLRSIRTRLADELEVLENDHRNATADVVRRATNAELEVAKANWAERKVWPDSDLNVMTPNASAKERNKILGSGIGGK